MSRPIFTEGFRLFFAAGVLFAASAVAVWGLWLLDLLALPVAMAPQHWHAHELIFGYGGAILAGFFLTAVPNWTGAKGAPQRFLRGLGAIWLGARLALALSGALPPLLVAALDLAFVPVLAAQLLVQLLRQPRLPQLIFVLLLALYEAANLLCHLAWLGWGGDAGQGLRAGLVTLCATIIVLGGRVTPGFTRNAMVASGREAGLPVNPAPLAAASIVAAFATCFAVIFAAPEAVTATLALLTGALALARVALWRGAWTLGRPILWTLHLSYALNALGFVALGASALGFGAELGALHLMGIGGVGGMTVSVLSRASLGHTGRALVAARPVVWAYLALPLAALTRTLGANFDALYAPSLALAALLWIGAFAVIAKVYWPIWAQPRLPRAPIGQPKPQ